MENLSYKIDWNYSKNHLNTVFSFINFPKNFHECIRMKNQDHKDKKIERKYLENMRNYQFLKVKNGEWKQKFCKYLNPFPKITFTASDSGLLVILFIIKLITHINIFKK